MNRAQVAKTLFLNNLGRMVTINMITAEGVKFYTARNAVAEAKKLLGDTYEVKHKFSQSGLVGENGWVCTLKEKPVLDGSQFLLAVNL